MSRTLKPVNQKSIYASFADVYEKIMNDEISIEKAEAATNALQGMNRTFALELKKAEVEGHKSPRIIELKNFEENK